MSPKCFPLALFWGKFYGEWVAEKNGVKRINVKNYKRAILSGNYVS